MITQIWNPRTASITGSSVSAPHLQFGTILAAPARHADPAAPPFHLLTLWYLETPLRPLWDPFETPLRPLWDPCPFCKMNPFWHRPLQAPPQQRSWKFMFIHRRFATKTARTKCNGFGKSKEFVLPSITLTYVGDCWRMFGHFERFFSTYWALFSSVWGYLGPIWGYVGPIWGYVGPMWAYLRLMLGLCWAYLDPFLAYIGPDQEFWPLLKNMQKHRILEQKSPPPS